MYVLPTLNSTKVSKLNSVYPPSVISLLYTVFVPPVTTSDEESLIFIIKSDALPVLSSVHIHIDDSRLLSGVNDVDLYDESVTLTKPSWSTPVWSTLSPKPPKTIARFIVFSYIVKRGLSHKSTSVIVADTAVSYWSKKCNFLFTSIYHSIPA